MAKRIKLPANMRSFLKGLFQELESELDVINLVPVLNIGFITLHPVPTNKLNLSIVNEFLEPVLLIFVS